MEPLEQRVLLSVITFLKDIAPGPAASGIHSLIDLNGTTFFFAIDDDLWRTDGTPDGTLLVKDLDTGAERPNNMGKLRDRLLFTIAGEDSDQLWISDGTTAGTELVTVLEGSLAFWRSLVFGEHLYFTTFDYATAKYSFWKTDGSAAGTKRIRSFDQIYSQQFAPQLFAFKDRIWFAADDGVHGTELWSSDGSSEGTMLVKDLVPGADRSRPEEFVIIRGQLYFLAGNAEKRKSDFWKSDGTADGTHLIRSFLSASSLVNVNGTAFFAATDGEGNALWKSNGTPSGTTSVKSAEILYNLYPVGDSVFFSATLEPSDGYPRLWKSDGTTDGTKPIFLALDSIPTMVIDDKLYFTAELHGRELWRSNESGSQIVRVTDINLGLEHTHVSMGTDGKRHFAVVDDGVHGEEPWLLDPDALVAGNLSGNVFVDSDSNSARDQDEIGLRGFRVFIDRNGDGICNSKELSVRTSSTGRYTFSDVPPGTYWVRVTPVEKYRFTTNAAYKVTLSEGGSITRHFGVTRNLLVSGTVYMDANVNGGKDELEPGLSGWRVFVDLDLDGAWDADELSTLTDVNGRYSFSSLAGGTYAIRVVQQTGYKRTAPQSGIRWVIASPGQIVTKLNFGEKRIA